MIHRIFDHGEVPSFCVLKGSDDQTRRMRVLKISRQKAIVELDGEPPEECQDQGSLELTLELSDGPTRELSATVRGMAEGRLFLSWDHEDTAAEGTFNDFLVAHSRDAEDREPEEVVSEPCAGPEPPPSDLVSEYMQGRVTGYGASILQRAHTIRSSDLAARFSSVRVLGMATMTNLIKEAVDEVLEKNERTWEADERRSLLEEAEEAFNERLEAIQAEKAGLQAQTENLRSQLGRAQSLLEEEQSKVLSANQFTMSDAGMQKMEQRLGRLIDRSLKSGNVSDDAQAEMRAVVSRLLDDERDKIREQAQQAQSDAIKLLERKVGRLAKTLDDAQKARNRAERRAHALEASGVGPAQNICTAGLDEHDPDREKKLDLLREVILVNRDVRQHMASAGTVIKGRKAAPPRKNGVKPPLGTET